MIIIIGLFVYFPYNKIISQYLKSWSDYRIFPVPIFQCYSEFILHFHIGAICVKLSLCDLCKINTYFVGQFPPYGVIGCLQFYVLTYTGYGVGIHFKMILTKFQYVFLHLIFVIIYLLTRLNNIFFSSLIAILICFCTYF